MFLQIVQDSVQALAQGAAQVTEKKLDYLELTIKGGWVMIPLAIFSLGAIYLFVERWLTIRKAGKIDPNFMANIKDMVSNGNIDGAKKLCQRNETPIARMIEKGISRIGKPLKNIEVAIENVGKLEIGKLERGLPILATISGAAPMIGFLGTVTGMIKAFFNMAASGNNIDIGLLSGGIYEAMVTTVGGLIVGIFAFIAYNTLTAKMEKVVYDMEASAIEFIDLLNEPA